MDRLDTSGVRESEAPEERIVGGVEMKSGEARAGSIEALTHEVARLEQIEHQLRAENENLREIQRAWEESLERYAEMFERSPVPCLTIDQTGIVRTMNETAAELLGTDLTGLSLRHRVAAGDRRHLLSFLSAGRTTGSNTTTELHLEWKGVGMVRTRLYGRILESGGGAWMVTLVDLSERDRLLEEQRGLEQNARTAQAATEARDQFIAMLSHELRTPLTPVMVAVSAALRRGDAPPTLKRMFEMIARNIEAERRLIDDLLDTTRIAHGKLRVDRGPADVHAVVSEAVDLMEPEIHRKGLSLLTDLGAERCWARADGARLRQVFWNLLQNAVKFSSEGGRIEVRSWNTDGTLAIEILDSGIGIAPDVLPRLFTAFQQGSRVGQGDTPGRMGLGLGLVICRGIVELHEGKISAASPGIGRGARFVVELPAIERPAAAVPANVAHPAAAAPAVSPGGRPVVEPRILLVEDDPDTADTLAELLRSEGFEIYVATSIAGALDQDMTLVDLVLSDIGLGDGSGLDLMRQLRTKREVPGIVLSGYGSESDILANQQAGFSAHLVKPVSLDKLVAAIRRTRTEIGAPNPA